jgi:hypothetical protein
MKAMMKATMNTMGVHTVRARLGKAMSSAPTTRREMPGTTMNVPGVKASAMMSAIPTTKTMSPM